MGALAKEHMPSLGELEQLARQPSSENWHFLLRGLTDYFLEHAEEYAEQYGEAFSDIICRILEGVTIEARAELSNRVAPLELFPNRIVKQLANDELPVAGPVLELSPVLSDSDLIAIAGIVMQDHWLAISRRKALGPRLTDALARCNDQEVIREMAGNPGAKFSASTYRMVAERAKQDSVLQERLVDRADLSQAIAIQLNPFLSDELKNRLKENRPAESKGLLDSLSELTKEEKTRDGFNADPDMDSVQAAIADIRSGKANLSQTVTGLADQGRLSGVCAVIGAIGSLPEKTVKGALLNLNGMPIAIMCRGLDLSQDAFEAVTHLRNEQLDMPQNELLTQVERYGNLDAADAVKTLAMLQAKKAAELTEKVA
ncbi:DUF2336 domain-containing protein [Mariluticola halotolerans]|uniref:DUF2336 domain-containing protein n=1 Tax=Mariluticola halotolerans TaxID=2909283 RepID=UPI0026E448FA|nr:DUF2336 domain-containing protein [Mariluticola halotolerans]UJQ95679.1 DUF2336 domain-containing protein [Mariluticola halotolerans]